MNGQAGGWRFRTTHALAKVYPDAATDSSGPLPALSVFLGETASFQIAIHPPETVSAGDLSLHLEVDRAARPHVRLSSVDLVPCDLAAFPGHDADYDRDLPGLYPDLLRPLVDSTISVVPGSWRSVWVDLRVDDPAAAGVHEVGITVRNHRSGVVYRSTVPIMVIGVQLPALPIVSTHWFHCDGLAQFYGAAVFSEHHWQLIDSFLGSLARMQVNTVLTPVWTPPLDTEPGGQRLCTQLLLITARENRYTVDFTLLDRWMALCRRHGIERLEMAHLFTQWGARATPQIRVVRDGESVAEFGWHVQATDPAYRRFLEQVLPALTAHLAEQWGLDRVLFHISDEPDGPENLAGYLEARTVVADLLPPQCPVIDALSDISLYDSGAVAQPVVATDAVAPFLDRGLRHLWVYYCVSQHRAVANRFFAMPSSRNRVLGHQLFAYECAGFLHWGFNFYNSELSRRPIDPFQDTTASGALLGGDAFMVYPGPDGEPLESIRYRVFTQAMFDLRAFRSLSDLAGREAVMDLIDTDGRGGKLRFDAYRTDAQHYLQVRELINSRIAALEG